jgi:hypothetical protein
MLASQALVDPLFFRADEASKLPGAVNDTRTFIASAKALVGGWNTTHPQVRIPVLGSSIELHEVRQQACVSVCGCHYLVHTQHAEATQCTCLWYARGTAARSQAGAQLTGQAQRLCASGAVEPCGEKSAGCEQLRGHATKGSTTNSTNEQNL